MRIYCLEAGNRSKGSAEAALQAEVGLPIDPNIPIIGFIGRLEEQKGLDILTEAIPEILKNNVQLIVLGTGKKAFEEQLGELEVKYPKRSWGVVKFNVPLAHLIIVRADFMLIPSRFEPCGLIQLQSMRYGTVSSLKIFGCVCILYAFLPKHGSELLQTCKTLKMIGTHVYINMWKPQENWGFWPNGTVNKISVLECARCMHLNTMAWPSVMQETSQCQPTSTYI